MKFASYTLSPFTRYSPLWGSLAHADETFHTNLFIRLEGLKR